MDGDEMGPGVLLQMVNQNHVAAEEGHGRLRKDWRGHEDRIAALEQVSADQALELVRLGLLHKTPLDVSALRFTPGMVAAVVAICASIIGGAYASTWDIRAKQTAMSSDVRNIDTKMDAIKQHTEDYMKFQDAQIATVTKAIGEIKAQQQMLDVKINNLRETVLTVSPRR